MWTLVRGERTRTRFNATERAETWRKGGANHGLLVRVSDDPAARFTVKDAADAVKLRVLYTLQPAAR